MTSQLQQRVVANLVRRYDRPVMNNIHRGEYLECLVAEILGSDWKLPWTIGHDWAPWDLEHSSGTRIEVKQSAALQPWHAGNSGRRTSPRFDVSPRTGYWTLDSSWIDRPGRVADIYVFGWHSESEESVADHRAPEQWTFFVVPPSTCRQRKRASDLPVSRDLSVPRDMSRWPPPCRKPLMAREREGSPRFAVDRVISRRTGVSLQLLAVPGPALVLGRNFWDTPCSPTVDTR